MFFLLDLPLLNQWDNANIPLEPVGEVKREGEVLWNPAEGKLAGAGDELEIPLEAGLA